SGRQRFPARQTEEASAALARLHQLEPSRCILAQQSPQAIDAGAFHTDVLAVGNEGFWMMHEHAFVDPEAVLRALREKLGPDLRFAVAPDSELALDASVAAYPFNSQVLTWSDGALAIVSPAEGERLEQARGVRKGGFAEDTPV